METRERKAWFEAHREQMIADIKRLVAIRSVKGEPAPGAPYGEAVRKVQLEAMKLCEERGFAVTDCDGRVAYAHIGDPDRFIAILAHLDVVPEGDDWASDPFEAIERDGWLVGRGTADDKGPFVLGLWAAKYLAEHGLLRYGIRLILGLDEETGMTDMKYYLEHEKTPLCGFTPDAEFPVCHGEKGGFGGDYRSAVPLTDLLDFCGGLARNAVPSRASALLPASFSEVLLENAGKNPRIAAELCDAGVKVTATGVAAHAGTPHNGVNANAVLAQFLLESGLLHPETARAMEFLCLISSSVEGAQLGIAHNDGLFTPLTIINGMTWMENGHLCMNVDCRYPTGIENEIIRAKVEAAANEYGMLQTHAHATLPFYIEPEGALVRTLLDTYNEITGEDAKPFVMSGGTYARCMPNTVSFGPEFGSRSHPDWVGTAHMKDEALSLDEAMEALEIYAVSLERLQKVDF